MCNDLRQSKHCLVSWIGFIGRTYEFRMGKVIFRLFKPLVRPNLEYCVELWSPHYRKVTDKLERVQRNDTKMIYRLRKKSYEEWLQEINFSLLKRRLERNLIKILNLCYGFDNNIIHYIVVNRKKTPETTFSRLLKKKNGQKSQSTFSLAE